ETSYVYFYFFFFNFHISLSVSLASGAPGSPGAGSEPGTQTEWVDCIQASDMCNQNPHCSSRYRVMRQCLVGKEKEAMLDNNRECQAALEVLLVSPLYDCRCKRGMKKELQCLQNYWTIHMGLTEGRRHDSSPYEPVAPNRHPDAFRLASISSGMAGGATRNCNPCLDAAKACNLNSSCKRQRSAYIAVCSKEDPNKGETCSRKRCHKALRSFLDRVPPEFSHRLLFCPCQTEGCAERRRQTIVPDCSYRDKEKPNCLELQSVCRQDPLCRSRLADYIVNCWTPPDTVSTCPNQDNHQACLASYARLIGTEMTPNYVDNSFSNWTISPWCTCKGSGNQEAECLSFLGYFNNNPCLSEPSRHVHTLHTSGMCSHIMQYLLLLPCKSRLSHELQSNATLMVPCQNPLFIDAKLSSEITVCVILLRGDGGATTVRK
uniref:GDNF family receptor alpha 2 n=1 Tax=Salarias fasciatus TaxID=181472 RepID=A0A672JKC1_SALFA